jgi:hypothetical protein
VNREPITQSPPPTSAPPGASLDRRFVSEFGYKKTLLATV